VITIDRNTQSRVETTIRAIDPNVSYRAVTAWRGRWRSAEPIAALLA